MSLIILLARYAIELKATILRCLASENEDIIKSALRNLPEYVLLAQGLEILIFSL